MSAMSTESHMAPSFRGEMPDAGGGPRVYGGYGQGATDEQRAVAGAVGSGAGMRVRCVETGEVFPSIRDAARALGADRSEAAADMAAGRKTCGYTLVAAQITEAGDAPEVAKPGPRGPARPCMVVETGEVFASITDAAEALGVTPAAVCRQVKRKAKCRGVTVVMTDGRGDTR